MCHPILQVQTGDVRDLGAIEGWAADAQEPHRALLRAHLGERPEEDVEVLVPPALTHEQDVGLLVGVDDRGGEEMFPNAEGGYNNGFVERAVMTQNVRLGGCLLYTSPS